MELDDLCIKIKIKFEFINTSSVFLRETSVLLCARIKISQRLTE